MARAISIKSSQNPDQRQSQHERPKHRGSKSAYDVIQQLNSDWLKRRQI